MPYHPATRFIREGREDCGSDSSPELSSITTLSSRTPSRLASPAHEKSSFCWCNNIASQRPNKMPDAGRFHPLGHYTAGHQYLKITWRLSSNAQRIHKQSFTRRAGREVTGLRGGLYHTQKSTPGGLMSSACSTVLLQYCRHY